MKKFPAVAVSLVWGFILLVLWGWSYYFVNYYTWLIVKNKAQSFFDQIVITRTWNAEHGGIYIPVTKTSPPNPYLNVPHRDIETIDGMKLTLVNPAYMTRQISEINKANNDLQFHITSLRPLRPANVPDHWEAISLRSFEKGNKEALELLEKPAPVYRYMAPLMTAKSCLKCHAIQGYKVGDIRGGISISFPATVFLKSKNTQLVYLSTSYFALLIIGILGIALYFRVRKRNEDKIHRQNNELVKLNQEKDLLLTVIGHDIRNPFHYFLGMTKMLDENPDDLTRDEIREVGHRLRNSAENLYRFLDNLIHWANLQQQGVRVNSVEFPLFPVLTEISFFFSGMLKSKNIRLLILIEESLKIRADRNMLNTVITNLVGNAIKFSNESGVITISCEEKDGLIHVLKIRDEGIGMNESTVARLFDNDLKISRQGTSGEFGTGMGMYICREFMSKMGGSIFATSRENEGTCFFLNFPHPSDEPLSGKKLIDNILSTGKISPETE